MKLFLPFCFVASSAIADVCPVVPDHSARLAEIYAELQETNGAGAAFLTSELWGIWTDAPNQQAQALLDEGMTQREQADFSGAVTTLDQLVTYCPNFAEGYNQRAFASFLLQDYDAALVDLERALSLRPRHIGAISGKGMTLMRLGRHQEAQEVLKQAVSLNPWLSERRLIEEPDGIDI